MMPSFPRVDLVNVLKWLVLKSLIEVNELRLKIQSTNDLLHFLQLSVFLFFLKAVRTIRVQQQTRQNNLSRGAW